MYVRVRNVKQQNEETGRRKVDTSYSIEYFYDNIENERIVSYSFPHNLYTQIWLPYVNQLVGSVSFLAQLAQPCKRINNENKKIFGTSYL